MYETTLRIDGMMCSMCEAHVNDAVRAALAVKRVTSSHKKGETVLLTDAPIDEQALRAAIEKTGYRVLSVRTGEQTTKKKRFSLFG